MARRLRSFSALALPGALILVAALGLALIIDVTRAAIAEVPPPAVAHRASEPRLPGERAVAQAEQDQRAAPGDSRSPTRLAMAYLLKARESGDPTYYAKAETLVQRALAGRPDDADAVIAAGSLAASRHDFSRALHFGLRAVELVPHRAAGHGVLVDALVELGRYEEAVAAAQRMVDLRPDQPSYARVSYLRELHGDLRGALDAMQRAIQAGAPDSEATAWSEVQAGNLQFAMGDLEAAERSYSSSTGRVDGYVYGRAGLGRVQAARGDLIGAAERFHSLVRVTPLPEFAAALGDLYARIGDPARAKEQYELVAATQRLHAANGVRVDVDLALFNADHGLDLAASLASARQEYAERPSVHVADALAWIEYLSGDLDAAAGHSQEALRLGSRDPLMLFRAGVIAQATGDIERAQELLGDSSRLNPHFSIRWAPDLAARLAETAGGN